MYLMNATQYTPAIRMNDTELSSTRSGTREVAIVSGLGGTIVFELYEIVNGAEHYEGRTCDARYALDWQGAAA